MLKNETAIITGAGRGIGAATAFLFAKQGASLVLTSRTMSQLQQTQKRILADNPGASVEIIAGDIQDPDHVRAVFDLAEKLGGVSILINNAAIIKVKSFLDTTPEVWDKTMGVNVRAVYFTCREMFQRVKKSAKSGSITNISSLGGIKGTQKFPGFTSYSVSKTAIVGLTECLAAEGRELGIRVNCVAPGAVDTQMLKLAAPFLSTSTGPEDIAEVIAYLSDPVKARAVTGSVVEIHSNNS